MNSADDLEIFVRDCSLAEIRRWLSTIFGAVSEFEDIGAGLICRAGDGRFIITPSIEHGPYTSIWFAKPGTPWRSDADCARQAAHQLGATVRCDPGEEYSNVDPYSPVMLEISNGTERLVTWEDA